MMGKVVPLSVTQQGSEHVVRHNSQQQWQNIHPLTVEDNLSSAHSYYSADLEDAEEKWLEGQPLVAVWMACSVVSFLSSLFWLPLGFIGGVLGIAGASLMLCRCHSCFNFALAVKASCASQRGPAMPINKRIQASQDTIMIPDLLCTLLI